MHCRAVEGDDWSSVVDGQTAETVAPELVEAQLRAARNPIATPFARASVHRSIGACHDLGQGTRLMSTDPASSSSK